MDKLTKTNIMPSEDISVEMVNDGHGPILMWFQQTISGFAKLGREFKVSPKCHMTLNKPGFSINLAVESVSTTVGIGRNHSAQLVMTKEAWEAFLAGESLDVTTVEDFKRGYVYKNKGKK